MWDVLVNYWIIDYLVNYLVRVVLWRTVPLTCKVWPKSGYLVSEVIVARLDFFFYFRLYVQLPIINSSYIAQNHKLVNLF